jgi:hypothetical protein
MADAKADAALSGIDRSFYWFSQPPRDGMIGGKGIAGVATKYSVYRPSGVDVEGGPDIQARKVDGPGGKVDNVHLRVIPRATETVRRRPLPDGTVGLPQRGLPGRKSSVR